MSGVPDLERSLATELMRLSRGRGVNNPDLRWRLGEEVWGVCGVDATDSPEVVRRRVREKLSKLADELPAELAVAAKVALGLHPQAQRPTLHERCEWLAAIESRDSRTARRTVNQALGSLAQAAAIRSLGSDSKRPILTTYFDTLLERSSLGAPGAASLRRRSDPAGGAERPVLAVDIAGYGAISDREKVRLREALLAVLDASFSNIDIDDDARWWADRGDGVLVVLNARESDSAQLAAPALIWDLVSTWPGDLLHQLLLHNSTRAPSSRIRLRAALHLGTVVFDQHGAMGRAVDLVSRLCDSSLARQSLSDHPSSPLAVVISDELYCSAERLHPIVPTPFTPATVTARAVQQTAWWCVPGAAAEGHGGTRLRDRDADVQSLSSFRTPSRESTDPVKPADAAAPSGSDASGQIERELVALRARVGSGDSLAALDLSVMLAEQGLVDDALAMLQVLPPRHLVRPVTTTL